ncbi:MAG: hypothetical protein NC826_00510 [Candidatus Omnitrophica bacterium]|nr:hypothetical protein [Candidatus Omnitrophota bacterium]
MKKEIIFFIFVSYVLISRGIICAEEKKNSDFLSPSSVRYTSYNLRDPFEDYLIPKMKLQSKKEEKTQLPPAVSIQGVIWQGTVPMAIIDNKVVKVGDTIAVRNELIKITEINKEGVKFLYQGNEFSLLSPGSIYKIRSEKSKKDKKEGGKE